MPSGWRCARAFKKIENAACFLLFHKEIWKQKHWPWQASQTKFSSRQKHYKSNQNNPVYVFVFTQAARIALKDLIFITRGMFLNHQDLEHVVSLVQISSSSFAICLTPWLCAPMEIQFISLAKVITIYEHKERNLQNWKWAIKSWQNLLPGFFPLKQKNKINSASLSLWVIISSVVFITQLGNLKRLQFILHTWLWGAFWLCWEF